MTTRKTELLRRAKKYVLNHRFRGVRIIDTHDADPKSNDTGDVYFILDYKNADDSNSRAAVEYVLERKDEIEIIGTVVEGEYEIHYNEDKLVAVDVSYNGVGYDYVCLECAKKELDNPTLGPQEDWYSHVILYFEEDCFADNNNDCCICGESVLEKYKYERKSNTPTRV